MKLAYIIPFALIWAAAEAAPTAPTPAPSFDLSPLGHASTHPESINLKQYLGHWVLLDFWATWCPPCKKTLPDLAKLKRRHQGLNILALNLDEDKNKAETFLKSMPENLVYLYDGKKDAAEGYAIQGMPTLILIDPQGNIHSRQDGYAAEAIADLDKTLTKLMEKK
jgi:thiol-disulfide isomerase/thioredoxin